MSIIIKILRAAALIGVCTTAACTNLQGLNPIGSVAIVIDDSGKPEIKLMASIGTAQSKDEADHDGHEAAADSETEDHTAYNYEAPNLRYELEGKIRSHPVDHSITRRLSEIALALDPELTVVVTSGGQDPAGETTGSHRHDIDDNGYGQSADIFLELDGRALRPLEARELYSAYIEAAAAYFPGIGHYATTLHIGYGTEVFWGPTKRSASADPGFKAAYLKGRDRS